jgi:serine/threonine protein kinase
VIVSSQIDHFTIVEVAGRGGMGVVYKAYDPGLDRYVALKLLRKDHSADAKLIAQLETEAAITASINDPNVVRVYATGTDRGRFYLAMELVDKGSLDDLIKLQGRVAEAQVLSVGIQIARGLRAAQQHGLIHRDVKPGNILFADAQTAKIVDFGLAIFQEQEATVRGEIWGTPYYVAPEKLDQQPEDFRSDMYSLGGTLFHALAGRPPFEAENASLVALKHLKNQPVSLQAFAPWVSGPTAHIINRTLAKNPAQRYASYDELVQNLEYALDQLQSQAKAGAPARQRVVLETAEDQKKLTWLVLGMIGAVAVFLTSFVFLGKKSRPTDAQSTSASPAESTSDAEKFSSKNAAGQIPAPLKSGISALASRDVLAPDALRAAASNTSLNDTDRAWAQALLGAAQLSRGKNADARKTFTELSTFVTRIKDESLASFLRTTAEQIAAAQTLQNATGKEFSQTNHEAIGLLLHGLNEWNLGHHEGAIGLLREFRNAKPSPATPWIEELKPLATYVIEKWLKFQTEVKSIKKESAIPAKYQAVKRIKNLDPNLRDHLGKYLKAEDLKNITDHEAELAKLPASGIYGIFNKKTQKVIEVKDSSLLETAKIQEENWSGVDSNQLWFFRRIRPGVYKIVPSHSGKPLSVLDGNGANLESVRQTPERNHSSQEWMIERVKEDWFKIRSVASKQLLTIATDNGFVVHKADSGNDEQLWRFENRGKLEREWHYTRLGLDRGKGDLEVTDSEFTFTDQSRDLSAESDSASFLGRWEDRDFEMVARIASIDQPSHRSKVGIMVRAAPNGASPYFGLLLEGNKQLSQHWRTKPSAPTESENFLPSTSVPIWLKAVRKGREVTVSYSKDGVEWNTRPAQKFDASESNSVFAAIAVSSGDPQTSVTVVVDNVRFKQTSP